MVEIVQQRPENGYSIVADGLPNVKTLTSILSGIKFQSIKLYNCFHSTELQVCTNT
jgi:hypothetical protein